MQNVTRFLCVAILASCLTFAFQSDAQAQFTVLQPVVPAVVGYSAERRGLFGRRIVYRPIVAPVATVAVARPVIAAPTVAVARPVLAAPTVTVARPVWSAPTYAVARPVWSAPTYAVARPVWSAPTVTVARPVVSAAPIAVGYPPVVQPVTSYYAPIPVPVRTVIVGF
jgi:hypothetical protein